MLTLILKFEIKLLFSQFFIPNNFLEMPTLVVYSLLPNSFELSTNFVNFGNNLITELFDALSNYMIKIFNFKF